MAANDPADLLQGRRLTQDTGLTGVLESDFFAWPNEVGGIPLLQTLARRAARFDWAEAPPDTAAVLYESVIPPEERRSLGEYYTPAWLARTMVRELITDPLRQRVLDPACGSGTFLAEAVSHFIAAGVEAKWESSEILNRLRGAVTGIDVHPVAVHLARSAWTLAARSAINAAGAAGFNSSLSIPVYLGDALQLRFRTGDMFAEKEITIQTSDDENTELVFPVSLVERAEDFDSLMSEIAEHIEGGTDPLEALDDNHINDPAERGGMGEIIKTMLRLHRRGRDHIWAYYTRNMVRPVTLSRAKVDVVIGNPPWINFNQTADILRDALEDLSRNRYGIWAGGRYSTTQDVAGLFFARSVDLYLKQGGVIGFVMPHSALQAGQHSKWRTGTWKSPSRRGPGRDRAPGFWLSVEFDYKTAWDLEQLDPNTFFPIPACVVFARNTGQSEIAAPLAGMVEQWQGKEGADDVSRLLVGITNTGVTGDSPYAQLSRQGATIVPRCLFFVNETENTAIVQAAQTVSSLWQDNKAPVNPLNLLGRLDYMGNLSAQLEWRKKPGDRRLRVMYTTAGQPTAALLGRNEFVAERLYWVTCQSNDEANYLLAVINSYALYESVQSLMSKGLYGARDLHKHLWKLPIPEFDPAQELHTAISKAGAKAATGAQKKLEELRKQEGDKLTVTIARRELRKWLRASEEGRAVEDGVGRLLGGG